jgi:hypothetical protein
VGYLSFKDVDFNFNSTSLKAYLREVSGLGLHCVKEDFQPAGVAFPTPQDTGMRNADEVVAVFEAEGSATGPNVKCALGTSATLTLTLGTGLTKSGTYWVSDVEPQLGADHNHYLQVTFCPTGTITDDYTT